jgi:hypothetical protein
VAGAIETAADPIGVSVAGARRRRLAAQLANCHEHLASMAEQDAHILEVLISQMRQHRDIDAILGEASPHSGRPSFLSQSAICCIGRPPADLTLSVLDLENRRPTTRANELSRPQEGLHVRTGSFTSIW